MSFNTFGHSFRVTTFGESHGPAIGCVVDGCPPRIALSERDIQPFLDRRRPGQSRFTTQRQEPDTVRILSGVFVDEASGQQLTTGTPIALVIDNVDQRSKDYSDIKEKYRPGHADYTYDIKYGVRDYRGGGRQSARETATRVAAGAIARKVLDKLYGKVTIRGALIRRFKERTQAEWAEVFDGTDACVAPVVPLAEAPAHPHLAARGTFVERDGVTQPAPAPRFSRTASTISSGPALPGEHTREALVAWGIEDVDALIAGGAAVQA